MKKGFTLAEILIVLTIVGVMAVMTIPSLMQNANSQHKITMFKKAFNAATNAYATEFATKTPPAKRTLDTHITLFNALNNNLNVKYYYDITNNQKIYNKSELDLSSSDKIRQYAIVTEDGIGYIPSYTAANNATCISKLKLNSHITTDTTKFTAACFHIDVRLNATDRGIFCSSPDDDKLNLNSMNCDTVSFYVTTDGVTAGNPDCTISGRIISNIPVSLSKFSPSQGLSEVKILQSSSLILSLLILEISK